MTKRQLVKFLEQKQADALADAEAVYKKAKENHILQLEEDLKFNQVSQNITMLISQADDVLDDWQRYIEAHPELNIEWTTKFGCLKYKLNDLTTVTQIQSAMKKHIHDVTPEKRSLTDRYAQIKNGINSNYANVIANVQQLKDAKLGAQYLTGLGFNLTTLLEEDKNPMTTALSVPVDTTFLFIPKVAEDGKWKVERAN